MKNKNRFLPFLALMLGIGLAFSQFAFKAKDNGLSKTMLIYGYDEGNPSNPWVLDGTPGYECVVSFQDCKYYFSTPPTPTTPRSAGIPVDDSEFGSYQKVIQ
ncbi:DUF6520 family protein [Pedobacter steynii]|uniref:Uncharacterized protein n=1 Tax=Pedobacter steynii TaxID=430522 RepID=A0A1D7QKM6_9SPHI|nr:DUF6520 family protein [Pedobacter steynii]AOM79200.1 hypothetical protein BFS30_19730 [Pedobacter steynii]